MSIVYAKRRIKASRPRRIADSYDARRADQRSTTRSYSSYSFMMDVHGSSAGSSSRMRKTRPVEARETKQHRVARLQQLATSKYANM